MPERLRVVVATPLPPRLARYMAERESRLELVH